MDVIQVLQNNVNVMQKVIKMLGGVRVQESKKAAGKPRKMSAAGRKRIAAAQRARWAKIRAAKK
jgi:hypothetical protein